MTATTVLGQRTKTSFVEILTMCPSGWFVPTAEGPGYLDEQLGSIHEVGELKRDGMLVDAKPA